MTFIVRDAELAKQLRARRERSEGTFYDEVWNGVYIVSPAPNWDHQSIAAELISILVPLVKTPGRGTVFNGFNVSERAAGWKKNYRVPDVVVIYNENPGKNRVTHFQGGPDFLVEILSPNDKARKKLDFYAKLGVREVLILGRKPWAVELYRFADGRLTLVETSTANGSELVRSEVVPLSFRLVPGQDRPGLEVRSQDGGQTWVI